MKKTVLIIITALLFSSTILNAQEGRPQYKIRNERAGVYIGDIIIELFPYVAPLHVANFDSLVSISFYDSTAWHRVVPDFVIQGGDPNSKHGPRSTWGEGDSTQATVPAEFSKVSHLTKIIGAARDTDINSATSQFYINTADNTGLDGNYTAYGIVVDGMDVVYDIETSQRDANDNPLEKIEMFITKIGVNEGKPGVPTLVEPVDNLEGLTTATNLVWSQDSLAVLTFLEISPDSNFTEIIYADSFAVSDGNTLVKFTDAELGEIKYYWRVRSNNGAKFSEYSEVRSFTTSIFPPELTAPVYQSTEVTTNPLLDWEPADGATTYRLQMVKTLPNFSESRLLIDESGITDTEKQLENLEPNTRYYWRVLCETSTYESPYSEVWLFTTGNTTSIGDEKAVANKFELFQNYPNPFNPSTSIKFTIPNEAVGKVSLKIFDVLGKEVKSLLDQNLSTGVYEVEFNASELPSGIYYYRLKADQFSQTRKMILIK